MGIANSNEAKVFAIKIAVELFYKSGKFRSSPLIVESDSIVATSWNSKEEHKAVGIVGYVECG